MKLKRKFLLRMISVSAIAVSLSGCLSPLKKQGAALAAATTPVVDQASAAYHAANILYDTGVDYQAVRAFDRSQPVYNPRSTAVLLPEKDIQIRIKVLQAFQLYVASVVAITNGTSSPALDAAATSVGNNLAGISNDVAPAVETTLGIAGASTAAPVTPAMRNGIATAANALGQFLVQRAVQRDLPGIVVKMDPHVKALCELLESDIDVLQAQEKRDYDTLLDQQTLFIRDSPSLSPEDKRKEIMKLPGIVRQQRNADAQLETLRASIVNLYLTHHGLAAQAQGNNPASLKNKIGDLEAAGNNLGTFYSSLPTT